MEGYEFPNKKAILEKGLIFLKKKEIII